MNNESSEKQNAQETVGESQGGSMELSPESEAYGAIMAQEAERAAQERAEMISASRPTPEEAKEIASLTELLKSGPPGAAEIEHPVVAEGQSAEAKVPVTQKKGLWDRFLDKAEEAIKEGAWLNSLRP